MEVEVEITIWCLWCGGKWLPLPLPLPSKTPKWVPPQNLWKWSTSIGTHFCLTNISSILLSISNFVLNILHMLLSLSSFLHQRRAHISLTPSFLFLSPPSLTQPLPPPPPHRRTTTVTLRHSFLPHFQS